VVDSQRDARREADVDVPGFERLAQLVAALLAGERAGHRRDAVGRPAGGLHVPAVARLGRDLVDVLRTDRRVHHVRVVRLEGPGLAGDGDERRRVGPVEEGLCVGLVLARVDDERARRVDDSRSEHVLAGLFDLGEHAHDEQAVDACAGRRHHVVRGAFFVALRVGKVGGVELGGQQPVRHLAAAGAALVAGTHRRTSASRSLARDSGPSPAGSKLLTVRVAP